ncbi:unnamed protein product [Rangifer tarandus platyrhynchus]|uniref:Uncharacterized protein n=1 Tax=Rangifer tarandus platyrhynchus TaxID=3082113 RepID=A0ABN8ZCF1_RANTA|nr:unnamed protein product [Rangifer tarandus platyrhynchus]
MSAMTLVSEGEAKTKKSSKKKQRPLDALHVCSPGALQTPRTHLSEALFSRGRCPASIALGTSLGPLPTILLSAQDPPFLPSSQKQASLASALPSRCRFKPRILM